MSTDAIVLLKEDHKEVASLFNEFQKKGTSDQRKEEIVSKVLELLTVHTYVENEVMYPQVRELIPDLESHILDSYEEHHVVDLIALELADLKPGDERFEAKMTVLMENVRHHVKEEEDEWFPQVRATLGRKALQELGEQILERKKKAPRTPQEALELLQKAETKAAKEERAVVEKSDAEEKPKGDEKRTAQVSGGKDDEKRTAEASGGKDDDA